MRLIWLLLVGVVLLFTSCRNTRLQRVLKQHPADTLDKYSYLLVTLQNSGDSVIPLENGTGFFYRDHERIVLVSAYHVLTGCPMYDTGEGEPLDSMDIWYKDDWGDNKSIRIPMSAYHAKPCKKVNEIPDVAVIDVTKEVNGVGVNVVDGLMCDTCMISDPLTMKDTVVCYGFFKFKCTPQNYGPAVIPAGPKGKVSYGSQAPKRHEKKYPFLVQFYYYIRPKHRRGDSGAPVFKIVRRDGITVVQLIGSQSGSMKIRNRSTVAKGEELTTQLHYLK